MEEMIRACTTIVREEESTRDICEKARMEETTRIKM
jgi:hypothetical protein